MGCNDERMLALLRDEPLADLERRRHDAEAVATVEAEQERRALEDELRVLRRAVTRQTLAEMSPHELAAVFVDLFYELKPNKEDVRRAA